MSIVLKGEGLEKLVDLKAFYTFHDIKQGLIKKLTHADDYTPGTKIVIDIGKRQLNSKQLHEIEDILLDYGIHLKKIISPSWSVNGEDKEMFNYEVPYYAETIMLSRHLRAGQRLFSNGNLVILGDINPGAEIIAVGNIIVMGSLRGIAHSGYYGDENAIIAAYRLRPTQLRIAEHFTRPPEEDSTSVQQPEVARIKDNKVIIERLKI